MRDRAPRLLVDAARRALAPVRFPPAPLAGVDPLELPQRESARGAPVAPRVSVVIPTRGAPTLTQCLNAVDAYTEERAVEVIVVDDASSGVALVPASPRARLVRLRARRGFVGAANAGARVARGELLVFLNDDAVVTPGWLEPLRAALSLPRAGIAAPCSNASGDDATEPARYHDLRTLLAHAASRSGAPRDVSKVSLLCAAMPRSLFEQVGGLDEGYGLGLFEDDELCMALRARHRRVLVAPSAWVHHHGSATFGSMHDAERIARFEVNRARFEQRWHVRWRAPLPPI